eukprot:1140403-Pelagomonas_calceolata.AAC.1
MSFSFIIGARQHQARPVIGEGVDWVRIRTAEKFSITHHSIATRGAAESSKGEGPGETCACLGAPLLSCMAAFLGGKCAYLLHADSEYRRMSYHPANIVFEGCRMTAETQN